MPLQKHGQYSSDELNVSRICFALSHPARYRMIREMKHKGIMTLPEIMNELKLSKSSVHDHLRVLAEHGLVDKVFLPNFHSYSLNNEKLELISDKMASMLH